MKINIFSVNFIKLWENILEHEEDKGETFSEKGKNWKRLGSIKKKHKYTKNRAVFNHFWRTKPSQAAIMQQ